MAQQSHRKTLKHYNIPGDAHFLTFSCYRRLPLLVTDRVRLRLVQALTVAREQFQFDLWAWVIMPEHVHLLIWPRLRDYQIDEILKAIKSSVARREIAYYEVFHPEFLRQLTVGRGKRARRRLWQAGAGFDQNVTDARAVHALIDYIHRNPVRRKLVARPEDWLWSSARDWAGLETTVPLRVDRTVPTLHQSGDE